MHRKEMVFMLRGFKKFYKKHFKAIAGLAIITIPSIYTVLFLGSMWDPYGNVENLPVAVVNHDKSVTYEDKELAVGDELLFFLDVLFHVQEQQHQDQYTVSEDLKAQEEEAGHLLMGEGPAVIEQIEERHRQAVHHRQDGGIHAHGNAVHPEPVFASR